MGRKNKNNGAGRPTVMTTDVLGKLEDAFINAFTDEMACLYAGINPDTLYEYCKKNPKFSERKELLKHRPDLTAQKQLVADTNTVAGARWWAEHKMDDFMPKTKIQHSGKIKTETTIINPKMADAMKRFKDARRQQILEDAKKML